MKLCAKFQTSTSSTFLTLFHLVVYHRQTDRHPYSVFSNVWLAVPVQLARNVYFLFRVGAFRVSNPFYVYPSYIPVLIYRPYYPSQWPLLVFKYWPRCIRYTTIFKFLNIDQGVSGIQSEKTGNYCIPDTILKLPINLQVFKYWPRSIIYTIRIAWEFV